MSDEILQCHGDCERARIVARYMLSNPHRHADGHLHVTCTGDRWCQIADHDPTDERHRPRIGSRFD